jgi:hypothetical protein
MNDPIKKSHTQVSAQTFSEDDIELLDGMSRSELYEFFFMHIKNIWRVDGLYFLGIERRHGTTEATDVDAECWAYMGKAEARELKQFLKMENPGPQEILETLRHTAWSFCHGLKHYRVNPDQSATFIVEKCRTQLIRLEKGLEPHPCRRVREGYLKAFVKELNPAVEVIATCCPPDRDREDIWCQWEFVLHT